MKLVIVTGSSNLNRALPCLFSWQKTASAKVPIIVVSNGEQGAISNAQLDNVNVVCRSDYLGTVPAFALGTHLALEQGADIVACLHDDLEIRELCWDSKVIEHFSTYPKTGLAGFLGATGLGVDDIYQKPYDPMQLIRLGSRSDMVDATIHGECSRVQARVACLDGFSQIGRAEFFRGQIGGVRNGHADPIRTPRLPIWEQLAALGLVHHIYDGALGLMAARYGWETWYLPVHCHHWSGQTAVGEPGYQEWARKQTPLGDQGFWNAGHRIVYEEFRDVLPLRVV